MKIQIKNPTRQERVRYDGKVNIMCRNCGVTFVNEAAALEHAWSIDNPVGMKDEDFNYCAHQLFSVVCYYETVCYDDIKSYHVREFGRANSNGEYDDIYNNEGVVVDDAKITYENGDNMWYCNGKVAKLAVEKPKMPMLQALTR
jgi:hypothetical protein